MEKLVSILLEVALPVYLYDVDAAMSYFAPLLCVWWYGGLHCTVFNILCVVAGCTGFPVYFYKVRLFLLTVSPVATRILNKALCSFRFRHHCFHIRSSTATSSPSAPHCASPVALHSVTDVELGEAQVVLCFLFLFCYICNF